MATDTGTDELSDTAGGDHNKLKTLGKYRIEKRIGAGGMGTVFLAHDDALNRTVALKVLPRDRAENPVLVRRFKAEGQAAAHMEHPNIVRVFEAGEADGYLYMALEFIEGIDVHDLVERRGLVPVKRSTDIIRQTTLALQHAYEKGIVHRDIKPSNLLIKRDGSVKLADMGLARSIDDTLETNITRAGTTVGTVDYMSPEQARNSKNTDVRSDIYSLGCTWYHMLTGHPPFPEGSMTNKLQAHAVSPRPDPRQENDRVPEGIVAIIQRMMARKPEDRHQTPQELLDDITAAGKMHRAVDDSALAALAGDDTEDWQATIEVEAEPELRMADDVDDLDLASLRDSAEYEVLPETERSPIKPRGKKSKKESSRQRNRRPTTHAANEPTVEEPAPPSRSRAYAPLDENDSDQQQAAARRTPPATTEPERTPGKSKGKKRAAKAEYGKSRERKVKRGSVTTAGGSTPALPGKEMSQPVDGSTKGGIDLEALKFVIPAVLVVIALGAIAFAIYRHSDSIGGSAGANPYAGENPSDGGPQNVVPPPESAPENKSDPEPDPQPPPQIAEVAFPGAENASPPTDGQKPLIPDWVDAFRQSPAAASRSLRVRRRPDGEGQVATINAAFDKLPGEGGIIEIDGDGPFMLDPVNLSNRKRIRLQAAEGRQPVIQLRPAEDWKSGAMLTFRGMQVELDGLHFVLVDSGPADGIIVEVQQGHLSLRNCSITVDRRQEAPLTALRVEGAAARRGVVASGRCLLENVLIRGDKLTAIALDGPSADLVIGNSLFYCGAAPAVVVNDDGAGVTVAGSDPPSRQVRLLASTILSSQKGIELRHTGAGNVVSTDVVVRQSVVGRTTTVSADSDAATMLALTGWPPGPGGLGGSHVEHLTLHAEQTTFLGWPLLVTLTDGSGEIIRRVSAAPEEWRKFWNQGLRSDAVIQEPLSLASLSFVGPDSVHGELMPVVRPLKDGDLPGYRPDEIGTPPQGLIEHVIAAIRQPADPDGLGSGMIVQGEPVRFDLSLRRSLARFIAGESCPDGTHVIAFGSGLKEIDPIVVENKSIRLEFESTEKSPLVIQATPGREGAAPPEALITVRNGSLDLVGAPLKLLASRSKTQPLSLILLDDASLAVRQCSLEGPRIEIDESHALVRTAEGAVSSKQRHLLLEDTFIVGHGGSLAGPVRWSTCIVRNCVLVTAGDAIAVTATVAEQEPAGLLLDHCTIASGQAAVRAEVAPPPGDDEPLLTIYARASIFAGSLSTGTSSVVVRQSAGAGESGALDWWGSLNGYADRLAGSLIDGSGNPGDFGADWVRNWGAGHEAHALTGKVDILFSKPLPDIRVVEPADFALADSATASTWGPSKSAIGADVDRVGASAARSNPSTSNPTSPQSPTLRPGKRNPGF